MSDIATLSAAAQKAQAALDKATAAREAEAVAKAAERTARSVQWALSTVATYPSRQAEANGHAIEALAAFDRAVLEDFGNAPASYLDTIRRQALANAVAEELVRARAILSAAGVIPPGRPNRPEPIGASAPFPMIGGNAFPTFDALVTSTIDAARTKAARVPASTVDPGSFDGKVSEAMRRDALASQYHHDEELALLAGMQVQHPAAFDRLSPEQRSNVAAWLACREAAGHGDDPLPMAVVQRFDVPPDVPREEDDRETLGLNRWSGRNRDHV